MPLTLTRIVTASEAGELITLAEAKLHLRVDDVASDEYITGLITAAREHLEESYGLALFPQTRLLQLDRFPCNRITRTILLPRPPATEVIEVSYIDTDGAEQVMVEGTDYQVDLASTPARIAAYFDTSWPATRSDTFNAVSVTYTCGYETLPMPIKQAMLLLIGDWYNNREETLVAPGALAKITLDTVARLMASYRTY